MLELGIYRISWRVGNSAWRLGSEMIAESPKILESNQFPEYEEVTIQRPPAKVRADKLLSNPMTQCYFDGGC